MQQNVGFPQDRYFGVPTHIQTRDGAIAESTLGTFELVQQYRSLSTITEFAGDFLAVNVGVQLKRRKVYLALVIDDFAEFSFKGHLDFLMNGAVVASLPLQKSYPPPIQIAPFNVSAGATLAPSILIPATEVERIVAVDQFTDSPWEPEGLIENELRNQIQYDRVSDETVYLYNFRVAPIHMHIVCNQISLVIDKWTASTSGGETPNDGVFACWLACISQQYGNT